ncbi:hypothetical protein PCASD_16767 [Puccinia coronata f. sp. avenae]|uniref:Uncharacterized protein n=1 Tax=Puccinia coronata f. sp. avenae TaxID=200324 RepID=A0A2N5TDY5_9BASI|nr:hypothetical protein PCASD_16767 [Puccinia coronata f. sp. avenae]
MGQLLPAGNSDQGYGGGTNGISHAVRRDPFGLSGAGKYFEGARAAQSIKLMASDHFAIDASLDEAKKAVKGGSGRPNGHSTNGGENPTTLKKRRG